MFAALAAALGVALGASPAPAANGGDPFDEVPAFGEYVEDVPTAGGRKAAGKPGRRSTPLPRKVERKIEAQPKPVATTLKKLTTPAYGAQGRAPKRERTRVREELRAEPRAEPDSTPSATPQALGAVFSTASTGSDGHLTVLLVLVLGSTGVAVLLAALRAYRERR